jgi:Holliday junction DNA helicase RuvA
MIAYLKGIVLSVGAESVVLDVSGVGYEAICSQNTLAKLQVQTPASLFAYTHVREDSLQIYGFETIHEKELFLSLLKVNGVGPKLAVKILSATSVENFLNWIEKGDVGTLSKIPKVGKKTAEQLVLALKGKLEFSSGLQVLPSRVDTSLQEVVSALVNLGFKESDCQRVVSEMPANLSFEEGVRRGLASLTSL